MYPCVNVHQQCTDAMCPWSERLNLLCGGEHTDVCSVCKHALARACASPRSHCALGLCWQLETLMTEVLSLGRSLSWDNKVASPTLQTSHHAAPGPMVTAAWHLHLRTAPWETVL